MAKAQRTRLRALQWKAIERRRQGWYRAGRNIFANQFRREGRAVVNAFRSGSSMAQGRARALRAVEDREDAWGKALRRLYRGVAQEFAPDALKPVERKALAHGIFSWIREESAVKVKDIQQTTRERIRAVLDEGVEAGDTIAEMAIRLEGEYEGFAKYRAYRIAATEVINAQGAAQTLQVSDEGNPEVEKEWLSSRDDAVRDSHQRLDGQRVKVDEAFEIDDQELRWPADSGLGADPSYTVNCRCTLLWHGD